VQSIIASIYQITVENNSYVNCSATESETIAISEASGTINKSFGVISVFAVFWSLYGDLDFELPKHERFCFAAYGIFLK
jgi:hypothetical protein